MSEESLNEKIQIALKEIRPFLESDGGNIELVSCC
jgi:Fe-S cluster biogenesis protein NfuA